MRPRLWSLGLVTAVLLVQASPARAQLIVNGGFETPALAPGTQFVTFGAGPTLPGWTVLGSIDLIRDFWPAAVGNQSIDLVGFTGPGSGLEQSFATVIGQEYELSFLYANNVDATFATGRIQVLGATSLLDTQVTHVGSTRANMDYLPFTATFTANSATTTLRFTHVTSDIPGFSGLALDAVSVTAVPEPGSLALLGTAAVGLCLVRRRRRAS